MIINDLYNNKKFVAEGEITKAAIEYKIKNDDGKFSQRHVEFAKSDLDKQLVRLKNNPNIKDVKIVQGMAENMADDMAAMAQKKFPTAYISKNGQEVQKPENWGKRYTPPAAAPADLEKQQRDLTAKYPNIDELVRRAELNRDPDYEMADGQAYYAARDAEQNYQKLRQIQRVIQGLNESILGFSAKDLDRLTGTKKTPDYSKKAIKYKYNQDQEPKSNKKSEPTEKQRQEYYQALGLSDSE